MEKEKPQDESSCSTKTEKPAPVKPDYGSYQLAPTSKLRPDPNQPRKKFADAALKELAESIRYGGVLQAIVVRQADQDAMHEIIMGERRWRAAGILGLDEVPIIIREMSDISIFEAQLVENLSSFRIDLDTLERAYALQKLIEAHGGQELVAKRLGKSQSWVSNAIAILDVPEAIMQLSENKVIKDKTTLVALNKIAKESPEAAQELMDQAKRDNGISREVVSAKLQELKGAEPRQKKSGGEAPAPTPDAGNVGAAKEGAAEVVPPNVEVSQTPAVKAVKRKNADKVREVTRLLGLDEMLDMEGLLVRLMDEVLASQAAEV